MPGLAAQPAASLLLARDNGRHGSRATPQPIAVPCLVMLE
jgi:hypothetical protein